MIIDRLEFYLIIAFIVLSACFYPVIKDRYKSDNFTEDELFKMIGGILEKNDMEFDKNKKYHYDFNTNILTIMEGRK